MAKIVKPVIKTPVIKKQNFFDTRVHHIIFDKKLQVENLTNDSKLDAIIKTLSLFNIKLNKIMATLAEVKQSLVDLAASVDANQAKVIARIQELKDQIAAGNAVTAADLDDLITQVKTVQTDVDTTDEG